MRYEIISIIIGMALGIIVLSLAMYGMFIAGELTLLFGFTMFILIPIIVISLIFINWRY